MQMKPCGIPSCPTVVHGDGNYCRVHARMSMAELSACKSEAWRKRPPTSLDRPSGGGRPVTPQTKWFDEDAGAGE
jgi:hypothetical protein